MITSLRQCKLGCLKCITIVQFDKKIDGMVNELLRRVRQLCGQTRAVNRIRWEKFARRCRRWFFGKYFFRKHRMPILEEEPRYMNLEWFYRGAGEVEHYVEQLYELMANDSDHWLDEKVTAELIQGGPRRETTLRMAKNLKVSPEIPAQYDVPKLAAEQGVVTMCAATYMVVPISECAPVAVSGKRPTTVHVRRDVIIRHKACLVETLVAESLSR